MAEKWSVVQNSPEYKGLSSDEQGQVKQRYFDNVVSKDAGFTSLSEVERQQVQQRFIGTPQPQPEQNIAAPPQNEAQRQPDLQEGGSFPSPSEDLLAKATSAIDKADLPFFDIGNIQERRITEQEEQKAREESLAKQERVQGRIKSVIEEGPQLVGSIVGGVIGGPPGAAALGGAGRLLSESINPLLATGEEKQAILDRSLSENISQSLKQTGKSATEEGLWDLAGLGVAKGAGKVFSPVIKKIAPRAAAMAKVFTGLGGKFSPAELDKRGVLRFLESASRNSLEGKELFETFVDEPASRAITKMSKMIASDLATGVGKLEPDIVADTLVGSIKGIDSSFDEVFSPAWTQLDDLTKTAKVETAGLKDFAEKELFELDEIKGIGGSAELEGIINKVDKLPEAISFSGMRRIKRDLIRQVKSLKISGDSADGVAKRLAGLAEEALLDPKSVRGAGKEAQLLHANLKNAYRTGKTAFKEAFPSKLIDALDNPKTKSATIKRLFPDNGIDNIKNIRNTLSTTLRGKANPEGAKTWNKLQRLWYEDLITRSTDATGKINSKKLEASIKKFGPKAVKEILGPERAKSLRFMRGAANIKQGKKANLAFLVRSLQISGAVTATGGLPGDEPTGVRVAGGAIALTPGIFALLSGNRAGNALLRFGVSLPKGSKHLPGIAIKLNAIARREKKKDEPETRPRKNRRQPN